ncbi:MAG: tRNA(fMet)-specific endonuclease VapC, partial [Pseudomonadota bacterium]|nr:tRNA(fMet)-specific endonuclease VapC [Pseudomonadota bacterium]
SLFNENASRMAISAITLSELFHGAEKSTRVSDNLVAIEDFCSRLENLPHGAKAAQHYGAIRAGLEKPCSRLVSTICTLPPMRAARGL